MVYPRFVRYALSCFTPLSSPDICRIGVEDVDFASELWREVLDVFLVDIRVNPNIDTPELVWSLLPRRAIDGRDDVLVVLPESEAKCDQRPFRRTEAVVAEREVLVVGNVLQFLLAIPCSYKDRIFTPFHASADVLKEVVIDAVFLLLDGDAGVKEWKSAVEIEDVE